MNYLKPTYYFDYESEGIQKFVEEFREDSFSKQEQAIGLYKKVRDGWKYDPYTISLAQENLRASSIVGKSTGHCIEKSILLISGLRSLGIPARLHLSKVKNHIAVEKLTERIGSNELTPHGTVHVFLNNKWIKASPAFNATLCERLNVEPLEFDGENDSLFQQYNSSGSQFMEYLEDYGHFEDVPIDFIEENMRAHYPHIFEANEGVTEIKL